jgi:hypothetical protein
MRFGRILLSLAPLIGLTAWINASGEPRVSSDQQSGTLIRLLQSVVQLAAPDVEAVSSGHSSARPSLQTFIHAGGWNRTPRRLLWTLTALVMVAAFVRRPQRAFLRC